MRLTETLVPKYYNCKEDVCGEDCIQKLGKLEDIEDELGCDLITLFKALRDGYYYKRNGKIYFSQNVHYLPYHNELELDHKFKMLNESVLKPQNYIFVCVRDYGITWALTREELE